MHSLIIICVCIALMIPGCGIKKKSSIISLANTAITLHKKCYLPSKNIAIQYPVIEGILDKKVQAAINKKIADIFMPARSQKDFYTSHLESDFEADYIANLLIITHYGQYYEEGAAHGEPFKYILYIDTQTGQFYTLKDLFNSVQDLEKIRLLLQQKFEHQKDTYNYLVDAIPPITHNRNFYLLPEGIEIYFHPYEIACYADGFPSFLVTWQEMDNIINKDGPFLRRFYAQSSV